MFKMDRTHIAAMLLTVGWLGLCGPAVAAVRIGGQVRVAGGPVASSTVTLWAASVGEPKQLDQTKTGADGRFGLSTAEILAKISSCMWLQRAASLQLNRAVATIQLSLC